MEEEIKSLTEAHAIQRKVTKPVFLLIGLALYWATCNLSDLDFHIFSETFKYDSTTLFTTNYISGPIMVFLVFVFFTIRVNHLRLISFCMFLQCICWIFTWLVYKYKLSPNNEALVMVWYSVLFFFYGLAWVTPSLVVVRFAYNWRYTLLGILYSVAHIPKFAYSWIFGSEEHNGSAVELQGHVELWVYRVAFFLCFFVGGAMTLHQADIIDKDENGDEDFWNDSELGGLGGNM